MDHHEVSHGLEELRDCWCQLEESTINTQQMLQSHALTQKELDRILDDMTAQQEAILQSAKAALNAAVHNPAAEFLQQLQETADLEQQIETLSEDLEQFKEQHRTVSHRLFEHEANIIAYSSLQVQQKQLFEEVKMARRESTLLAAATEAEIRQTSAAARSVIVEAAHKAAAEADAKAVGIQALTGAVGAYEPRSPRHLMLAAKRQVLASKMADKLATTDTKLLDHGLRTTSSAPAAAAVEISTDDLQITQRCSLLAASYAARMTSFPPLGGLYRPCGNAVDLESLAGMAVSADDSVHELKRLKRALVEQEKEALVAALKDVVRQLTDKVARFCSFIETQPHAQQPLGELKAVLRDNLDATQPIVAMSI